MKQYDYLEINIDQGDFSGEFVAQVLLPPPNQPTSARFQIDLESMKQQAVSLENSFGKHADALRGKCAIAPDSKAEHDTQMRETGALLFHRAIFKGDVLDSYRRSVQQAESADKGLCIKLRINSGPLMALPWEFMYDTERGGGRFIGCSRQTPIVRTYGSPVQAERELDRRKRPLRILIVPANPLYVRKLDSKREIQEIKQAFNRCPGIEIKSISDEDATWDKLIEQTASSEQIDILHFTMHGDAGRLNGVDQDRRKLELTESDLAILFDNLQPRPILVVINACSAGQPKEGVESIGLLPRLSQQGIPFVVGMQFSISDVSANRFSQKFYQQLASGNTVLGALTTARLSILKHHSGDSWEWGIPVLYLNGEDVALFPDADPVRVSAVEMGRSDGGGLRLRISGSMRQRLLGLQIKQGFDSLSEVVEAAVVFLREIRDLELRGSRLTILDRDTKAEYYVSLDKELSTIASQTKMTQFAQPENSDMNGHTDIDYTGIQHRELRDLANDMHVVGSPADVVGLAIELYEKATDRALGVEKADGEEYWVEPKNGG